jgi:hypothetical protein
LDKTLDHGRASLVWFLRDGTGVGKQSKHRSDFIYRSTTLCSCVFILLL